MKRLFGVLLIVLGVIGVWTQPAHAASTNDFRITSYIVDMKLGKNSENRSTLETKETITATFPDYDQNHGLERAFVTSYDGHTTKLSVMSVTDETGRALNYSMNSGVMRIGDADTYVHGSQTYVIKYMQQDVTRFYADTNRDEFYWDAIGTDWKIPIDSAKMQITLRSGLTTSLSGDAACYRGSAGSSTACQIDTTETGYVANVTGLQAYEGMTVAVGFKQGTFTAYTPSLFDRIVGIWIIVQLVGLLVTLVLLPIIIIRQRNRMNRKKELVGTPAEFLPPKDASVTTSSKIIQFPSSVPTAQLLDLAVRHYIKIYETSTKTLFSQADYTIEIAKDVSDLRWEERELLLDSFGNTPAIGDRLKLSSLRNNTAYYFRTLNNDSGLTELVRGEYNIRELDTVEQSKLRRRAAFVFLFGLVTLSPVWWLVSAVYFSLSFSSWRFTDKGLELRRYLEGLKEYIKMAETDRIKMLQSPEGAEKVARVINGTDEVQLIKLYERVLPYAVLFGLESEWNKQLGRYYETTNTQPGWFVSQNGLFNAAVFTSAMSSLSTATNYTSSSSSSSGGSSGGGFSGGGGGGGGGGGW